MTIIIQQCWACGKHHNEGASHKCASHLPANFTPQQFQWISERDWFVSGTSQEIIVRECWIEHGQPHELQTSFTDWKKLRNWAGY